MRKADQSPSYNIPALATTKDGIEWRPLEDLWRIPGSDGTRALSFERMRAVCDSRIVDYAKFIFTWYLENYSASYCARLCAALNDLLASSSKANISIIDSNLVIGYAVPRKNIKAPYLVALRVLFEKWRDIGLPGLAPDVVAVLKTMRLKGNEKGVAVLTADPLRGPFTDIEFQAITAALNNRFAEGEVSVGDFLLVWLFLALGARPIQLAMLKAVDLSVTLTSDEVTAYILQVPRAKQRHGTPRSAFKARKLIPDIGHLLERYIITQREFWRGIALPDDEMPLFIQPRNTSATPGLAYHCSAHDLGRRVDAVFAKLSVFSERTGKRIKVNTRRFRYTRGTRAAMEGASELVIAELLDHNDTQNVGVYVEAVPEIVERIDRAMAMHLAPLAQAFVGQLIDGKNQAARTNDAAACIVSPDHLESPVGRCGSFGFCNAMAPIACYTCSNFQPWLEGPHEQVLDSLLLQRATVLEETGDVLIASINDRTIYACADVVRRCAEKLSERGGY